MSVKLKYRGREVSDTDVAFIKVAVDARIGLDLTFNGGDLGVSLGALPANQLQTTILTNRMGSNEPILNVLMPLLVQLALPTLADSLGSFPLPDFLGLQLSLVDLDRNGEFLSLFMDLTTP